MTNLMQISSMEKILPKNECFSDEISEICVLQNECAAYQIAFKNEHKKKVFIKMESDIEDCIEMFSVGCVPVTLTTFESAFDDPDYISKEPGLFPDILMPIKNNTIEATGWYQSIWINIRGSDKCGVHKIKVTLITEDTSKSCEIKYEILPITLPESNIVFTQWFHTDCIAKYYNVPVWSEKHWEYIEKFIQMAVKYGMNMILTPLFTPPLDTEIGGERPTVQLIKVSVTDKGYIFDFENLKRWIKLCKKCGIQHFEMSHLFTQWGAKYTPKIIAEVNGTEQQIFGWNVSATDENYKCFLKHFLPKLIVFLKSEDVYDETYFHISDEPGEENLGDYLNAKNILLPYIDEDKIIDAISDYELYKTGVVKTPVVAIDHMNKFIGNVDDLWGYYCCMQLNGVSNRMIAMPSSRNRYIALQMFKFKLKGFLQWGYNYYYNELSRKMINPFFQTDGECTYPAGDPFSVYPGDDGPIASIRLVVFYHALQDLSAMRLLAEHIGYDNTVKLIEKITGNIRFEKCTSDPNLIIKVRSAVNQKLSEVCMSKNLQYQIVQSEASIHERNKTMSYTF